MIPDGWTESTVGKSYKICNNLRFPINLEDRKGMKGIYPYYGPTGILNFIDEYRLDGEYALIGEDGDHFLKYNNKSMTLLVNGKINVNNHAHIIQGDINSRTDWFYYYFMNRPLTPYLTRQGAGRYKLTKSALENIPILIPTLLEQCKIAEILGVWDESIDLLEKLIGKTRSRKQGLMQQLLTGKKRFKDFEGSEWKEYSIKDLCKVGRGRVISRVEIENNLGSYPVYSSQTSNNGEMGCIATYDFDGEYVTWTTDGANAGTIFYRNGKFNCTNVCGTLQRNNKYINMQFLAHQLSVESYKHVSYTLANPKLMNKEMGQIILRFPPLAEQEKIAAVLSAADEKISMLEKQLAAYKQQKLGLMQQLLTGKIRVGMS